MAEWVVQQQCTRCTQTAGLGYRLTRVSGTGCPFLDTAVPAGIQYSRYDRMFYAYSTRDSLYRTGTRYIRIYHQPGTRTWCVYEYTLSGMLYWYSYILVRRNRHFLPLLLRLNRRLPPPSTSVVVIHTHMCRTVLRNGDALCTYNITLYHTRYLVYHTLRA